MTRSLKDFFRRLWAPKPPRLQHLQVEVTTRCDLPGCLMCPRRAMPERWLNHDLSWQNFERLIPAFKLFTQVHLSGWGEPLLHPRLWDMAQAVRSQGCTVSLTTNGMNLTAAMQVQVLEHLDMVAVSLDGARAETFERLRPGADFQRHPTGCRSLLPEAISGKATPGGGLAVHEDAAESCRITGVASTGGRTGG